MSDPRSHGAAPTGAPDDFAEQFFERQRRETLDRIASHVARRRTRRIALPLAAVLLVGAVFVGSRIVGPSQPVETRADDDWLFAWSLPAEVKDDPLAPFGSWNLATESDELADSLLPPLPEEFPQDNPGLATDIDSEV